MATGENVLWIVEKRRYKEKKITQRYIFRTRAAANMFQENKNVAGHKFEYSEPKRATWGPEQ